MNLRCNNEALFRRTSIGFADNGYCNLVNTGNTNGSAFLGVLSNRVRPAGNRVVHAPNRHLSILERSRFTCSRCSIVHAILLNGPGLYRVVSRGRILCGGTRVASRSNVELYRLRRRFTRVSN